MFKKFNPSVDISTQNPLKSSIQRSIRAALLSQWKIEPETLESIWGKKEPLVHVKCREHISLYAVHSQPLFFQHFDGPFLPTLRNNPLTASLTDPYILPIVKVDRGAIRFLLSGAHMMCPGFTSAGGYLPSADAALPAGQPVAIHAEGKDHAAGIGITKLGTEEIREVNKGVAVESITYLGDDLWALQNL